MTIHRSCIPLFLTLAIAVGEQTAPEPAPLALRPVPPGETRIVADIVEPALSGAGLAQLYQRFSGHRVVVSAAAATAEFSFVQEASPRQPLTSTAAARLLRKTAAIEGFAFIPDDDDASLEILAPALRETCPGPPSIYGENDPFPEGDGVITYAMTFKHLKPDEAAVIFSKRCGTLGPYGSIDPFQKFSALIVTGNAAVIRKLVDLKKEIDKP